MNIKKAIHFATIVSAVVGLTVVYNNCSGGAAPDIAQSQASSVPATNPTKTMSGNTVPSIIYEDQTSQINVVDGASPYSFAVTSGTATVSSSGVIHGSPGQVQVQIRDSQGQLATVSLQIFVHSQSPAPAPSPAPSPTPSAPAPCVTPFGNTIQDGESFTAYNAAQIDCPSTVKCSSEVRVCHNGVLSGSFTAKTCAYNDCVYRKTDYATDTSSGQVLCLYTNRGNSGGDYSIPTYSLGTTCTPSQYNTSKWCNIYASSNLGQGNYDYEWDLYTCRGPNEVITPQRFYYSDGGGG